MFFRIMPPYKYLSGCQKRKKAQEELEKKKNVKPAEKIENYFFSTKKPKVDEANVDDGVNEVDDDVNDNVDDVDDVDETNANGEEDDVDETNANVEEPVVDIFNPKNWDKLSPNMKNVLVEKGPKRDLTIEGPEEEGKTGRRFRSSFYIRTLTNREKHDRTWLVYSKENEKAYCFCCKLFRKGMPKGGLDDDGYNDWVHVHQRLKEHEVSMEHLTNMTTWFEMRQRLKASETIDKVAYELFKKEKDYWNQVLLRIIAFVKYLAKYNISFRGSNEKLYEENNGNFLGLVEMTEEFDPIMKEHVRRITSHEAHVHYLGHKIQNELILLLAGEIKSHIINNIKEAKYYSIILDCTPDVSHQEQMSLIIRYVNHNSNSFKVEESFLGFLNIVDTTGEGIFKVACDELVSLGLDVDDLRGQGYDNGSNMKGPYKGVQSRFIEINPRAFYTPCGCHSLNLALCDMANTCAKARDFFGTIQRVYTIFANSTKRWEILKDNVKGLTLKSLSTTRWESRVESVKAIRFQLSDIREALLEVGDKDNDIKIQGEAKSLARTEIGDFEFIVSIVIWYQILSTVNTASKKLQGENMLIDVAMKEVKNLVNFFKSYREVGLSSAIQMAEEIALEMDVEPVFPQRRQIRRKRQFDEVNDNEVVFSPEEDFRVNYFLTIVDQAIESLESRFTQYEAYEKLFGFLFPQTLRRLDDEDLKSYCSNLEDALKHGEASDIDANELYSELKLMDVFLPSEIITPFEAFEYLAQVSYFPNALVAYRVLLTIPVTVASAERSFSKLKLLKSYLRSTMSQERLNGLALISIENELLRNMNYEELIHKFASENARRTTRFMN